MAWRAFILLVCGMSIVFATGTQSQSATQDSGANEQQTESTQADETDSGGVQTTDRPEEEQTTAEKANDSGDSESPNTSEQEELLQNGSLDESVDGSPTEWSFSSRFLDQGYELTVDDENPFEGTSSVMVDSTNAEDAATKFCTFNQSPDVAALRGKRVRFRAAVRTSDTDQGGKAQLWLRVDRESKKQGAFDNMGDRPITSDQWKHYEIVADIDDDAERLNVGLILIGKAKAWIDDASLEIVPDEEKVSTKVTGRSMTAEETLPQPFFNGWLWLAGFAIALMILSQQSNSFAQRFALRFALIYWLLYSFPTLVTGIGGAILRILGLLGIELEKTSTAITQLTQTHKQFTETAVHWTASNVFGKEGQLVLPNGSGDTTFAYIRVFACCIIALSIAAIWTGTYWRKADQLWLRDMLRTYLRYVLALTMLGYGLAKTGFNMTQFAMDATPGDGQLMRTFGDASPMGLLWTFMAASPAYTFFAGLGEVIGGLLLVFRRTATLGALATFGVMLNVMMLNFCYDVPVKQYSFHLVMMALVVAMPDFPCLFNLLVMNRTTEPANLMSPPYTNRFTVWIPRLLKIVVVACAFAWPVGEQIFKEVKFYQTDSVRQRQEQADSEHLLINRGFRWINEVPYNR